MTRGNIAKEVLLMPVNIELGGYRITTDPYNWNLEERQGKDGKQRWEAVAFYSTLGGLLNGLAEIKVRQSNARTFEEIRDLLAEIHSEIGEIQKAFRVEG